MTQSHDHFSEKTISYFVLSKVWLDLSRSELSTAIRHQDEGNLVRAHSALMNCPHPFQTAKKYSMMVEGGERWQIEEEVGEVEEQISSLEVTLESGKLRQQGLAVLKEAMEDENYEHGKLWLVVDFLKQAILRARGSDLEAEIIASAEMGRVLVALQLKEAARVYFRYVIDSAVALAPRIVHSEPWYQMAMKGLEDIRGYVWAQEEKERQAQRKPILEKLKPQLDVLEEAEKNKDVYQFLKLVFETHPPKVEGWTMPDKIDRSTGKKLCRQACAWYHPDKNQKDGAEWEVLCEEIVKMVTRKYAIFKE